MHGAAVVVVVAAVVVVVIIRLPVAAAIVLIVILTTTVAAARSLTSLLLDLLRLLQRREGEEQDFISRFVCQDQVYLVLLTIQESLFFILTCFLESRRCRLIVSMCPEGILLDLSSSCLDGIALSFSFLLLLDLF